MPNPIPPVNEAELPDEERRKRLLGKFQDDSLAAMRKEEAKLAGRKEAHAEEQTGFAERGAAEVKEEERAEIQRKRDETAWRADQKRRKEAIEADKRRKAAEELRLKEKREKEEKYEKERHKYFDSLHEDAARKALAEREAYEREQKRKDEIHYAERDAAEAKYRAGTRETQEKEKLEHGAQVEKERIDERFRDRMKELHEEEQKQRQLLDAEKRQLLWQIEPDRSKPGYRDNASRIERECDAKLKRVLERIAKDRVQAEEDRHVGKRIVDGETVEKRVEAEVVTAQARRAVQDDFLRRKAEANTQYGPKKP